MIKLVIFDLDGVLANLDHRLPYLKQDPPNYEASDAAMPNDTLNRWAAEIFWGMGPEAGIFRAICTARSETKRGVTSKWLTSNSVTPEYLLMRKNGDERPDYEVKKDMLAWIREHTTLEVLFVLEDRPSVVRMWVEEGITCLAVAGVEEF